MDLVAARWKMGRGESPVELFGHARTSLQQAMRIHPQEADCYDALAKVEWRHAEWQDSQNLYSEPQVANGLQTLEKCLSINPNAAECAAVKGVLPFYRQKKEPIRETEFEIGEGNGYIPQRKAQTTALMAAVGQTQPAGTLGKGRRWTISSEFRPRSGTQIRQAMKFFAGKMERHFLQ